MDGVETLLAALTKQPVIYSFFKAAFVCCCEINWKAGVRWRQAVLDLKEARDGSD
jgi:hypothetical protein